MFVRFAGRRRVPVRGVPGRTTLMPQQLRLCSEEMDHAAPLVAFSLVKKVEVVLQQTPSYTENLLLFTSLLF